MTREAGVAHSEGIAAFFCISPNHAVGFFAKEDSASPEHVHSPEEITRLIATQRSHNEHRQFYVVVEGGLPWLRAYRSRIRGADVLIYLRGRGCVARARSADRRS